jgi:hypothetical protein
VRLAAQFAEQWAACCQLQASLPDANMHMSLWEWLGQTPRLLQVPKLSYYFLLHVVVPDAAPVMLPSYKFACISDMLELQLKGNRDKQVLQCALPQCPRQLSAPTWHADLAWHAWIAWMVACLSCLPASAEAETSSSS